MNSLLTNWRTTSAGLVMIAGSVVHLVFAVRAGTASEGVWTASISAIIGGIGLIAAGDATASVGKAEADTTFVRKETAGSQQEGTEGNGLL